MAQTTKFTQVEEEMGLIERIPCDREPIAEELRHVDDLGARLRAAAESGGKRCGYVNSNATVVQAR